MNYSQLPGSRRPSGLVVFLLALLLINIAAAGYFGWQYFQTKKQLENPKQAEVKEIETLLNKLGKLMDLPQKEKPTIATVTDKSKLKDREFFQKAQNGDKVIIYQQAKKAILYRPSTNKIIEVSNVNIQGPTSAPVPDFSNLTVAIYNATDKEGYASVKEQEFLTKVPSLNVVEKNNSVLTYSNSQIIDVNGTQTKAVSQLSQLLNLAVSDLLSGEATPEADILIIVSK